ncbi:hypothetical protein [Streptomyces sp. 2-1]|uniref:hypothetical protein n=1 Tax=Streptomyces sp. 2-1 TaxID=412710 RepID=UPI003AFB7A66
MSEIQASSTELTSQYIAQITGDLERNTKEQERIGVEVEALQEQLRTLQHDHTVLVNMQQALGGASPAAEAAHQGSCVRAPPSCCRAQAEQVEEDRRRGCGQGGVQEARR